MTATGTTTIQRPSSPPPVRPRRGVVTAAAGLIVVAAVTLTPWLVNTGSQTESGPMSSSAVASPQQALPVPGQASAGSNARSISGPAAYVMFCQNSPSLCVPPAPTLATGYLKFCGNSPTLCVLPRRN
jgi:hypothetical protein